MKIDYKGLKEDYQITDADDDRMVNIKTALQSLSEVEQRIFLAYCELGSYAATAREFNVSAPTAKTYLNNIKNKLLTML